MFLQGPTLKYNAKKGEVMATTTVTTIGRIMTKNVIAAGAKEGIRKGLSLEDARVEELMTKQPITADILASPESVIDR